MQVPELSALEAAKMLSTNPNVKLIDVRTDQESATARIPGAILVNNDEKAKEVLTWPKDAPIIVHCHHGFRSAQAAGWLKSRGFSNVFNLGGGIDAWSREVDPSVPRY